jgi:hypothetical protein
MRRQKHGDGEESYESERRETRDRGRNSMTTTTPPMPTSQGERENGRLPRKSCS